MKELHLVKGSFFKINGPILQMKLSFFLGYAVWFSTQPYLSVMPTQIVSYDRLAILYAWSPLVSIFGPVIIGFIGDKLGNYKSMTIFVVALGGIAPFSILWIFKDHQSRIPLQRNSSFHNLSSEESFESMNSVVEQSYTFPLLVIFRLICFFSATTISSTLDACGLAICKKHDCDFGRQKLWAYASGVTVPFICGISVDLVSNYLGYVDDTIAFGIGGSFAVLGVILISKMDIQVEKNKKSLVGTVRTIGSMIDFGVLVLVEIIVGVGLGFHLVYRPVFATELQASKTLIGLILASSNIGTMVLMGLAKYFIVDRLGEANTIIVSLMMNCIRSVTYSYLDNPLYMLATEIFDSCCSYLALLAGTYYCAADAPEGMLASLSAMITAAVFGAGRGIGTSVGSTLISKHGMHVTYRLLSYLMGGTAIVYFVLYHSFLKKMREKRNLSRNKEPTEIFGIDNPVELETNNFQSELDVNKKE